MPSIPSASVESDGYYLFSSVLLMVTIGYSWQSTGYLTWWCTLFYVLTWLIFTSEHLYSPCSTIILIQLWWIHSFILYLVFSIKSKGMLQAGKPLCLFKHWFLAFSVSILYPRWNTASLVGTSDYELVLGWGKRGCV